jgi:hypothetical protein
LSKVQQWTISHDTVHEPLVSEADFIAAQARQSTATSTTHEFATTGLFSCQSCGRSWNHPGITAAQPTAAATAVPAHDTLGTANQEHLCA